MRRKQIGLYIHIPFCKRKCSYCDFCSYAEKQDLISKYIKCLLQEIKEVGSNNRADFENGKDDLFSVKTIYIGGGTPSLIESKYIVQIMEEIKSNFELDENAEITIEVNPGTVTKEKLRDYKKCGINRLSIGLQSVQDDILKEIGRIHNYKQFLEVYKLAREVGFKNINIDLMIGIPGQKIKDLKESLEEVVKLQPEHISVYSLIVEDGTPIANKIQTGELKLLDEELERNMYWYVKNILELNGYKHYEISNFAKKGYESKHNINCWNQEQYFGFGAAAHSYRDITRYSNTEKLEEYIRNVKAERLDRNRVIHEIQKAYDTEKEYMLLGLRKIDGIKISEFKLRFGDNPIYLFRSELKKLTDEKLLIIDEDNIRLTNKGIDFANLVWEEFV